MPPYAGGRFETASKHLPPRDVLWLLLGLALAVAPHTARLPWWVDAMLAALFAWRAACALRLTPLPGRAVLLALALASMIGVYLGYRTIFGRDAGVTLLSLLLALKLMEARSRRDIFVLVFIAYFQTLTNFFYSQTIPTAALMLATVLVLTSALVTFNAPARPILDSVGTAVRMLVQAVPAMLILFFLFPRVQGPLWGLPQDAYAGVTGLSDTMSPGSISRLSASDAIAFRVKFRDRVPPRAQRYWRGPVLWDFDGQTWRAGSVYLRREMQFEVSGAPVDYEVTLEPHNRNWLFALEMPDHAPPNARFTSDYQLISLPPVRNRIRYELRSYPNYLATGGGEPGDLAAALALPQRFNPRARALAREWRETLGSDAAVLRRAIDFYRGARFEYTLQPPLLGANPVDEFLFDTKQGFCEHFASSFVYLMRAAGIPARVVTGYQGGEINTLDGYLVVRQTDAHAWAEVWLPGNGWTRVDPTAAAVPIRIESGITAAAPGGATLPLLVRTHMDWLRDLRDGWDALANQWNQWVLGYNPDRQREMLTRLGVRQPDWQTMTMLLSWSLAAVLLAVALWLLRGMRRSDPVQRSWVRFCEKLRRAGLERGGAEGPLDFAARAVEKLPGRTAAVRAIAELYVNLRYGPRRDAHESTRLKRLVQEFRP